MRRIKKKIYLLMLLVVLFSSVPFGVYGKEKTVTLAGNGVEVTVELPPEWTKVVQTFDDSATVYIGETQVSLEIRATTMKKEKQFIREVYSELKKSAPDTTFYEELPDMKLNNDYYVVRKTMYKNSRVDPELVTMEAFCKLNYRYIYTMTVRNTEDGNPAIFKKFDSYSVKKTPYHINLELLLISLFMFFMGLGSILYLYYQKHFGLQATGTVIGFIRYKRSRYVEVSYQLRDGTPQIGKDNSHYQNKIGDKVAFTYFAKTPQSITLLTSKKWYYLGAISIFMALFGFSVQFFIG